MKFIDLFNRMHCDFFEIHTQNTIEVFWDWKQKINDRLQELYDVDVRDFYAIQSKNGELGLLILLDA